MDPERLDEMERLPFDQRGIAEYQVMVGGKLFMGVVISTLSEMIAYARTSDQPRDFFDDYIFPNSSRVASEGGLDRIYADALTIKGNEDTKLLVTDGQDIMDAFP